MTPFPPRVNTRFASPDAKDTEAFASGPSRLSSLGDKRKQRSVSLGLESLLPNSTEAPTRRKDLREHALVRKCEAALLLDKNQYEQHRSSQYHARWSHLRDLYALMCGAMASIGGRQTLSPMSPSRVSVAPVACSPSTPPRTPAALDQGSAAWLRDLACGFRRTFPVPEVTLAQLESAVRKALHVDVFAAPAFAEAAAHWRAVFQAFQRLETLKTDYRELLSALSMLDRRRASERTLLALWFEEFSTVPLGAKTLAVSKPDLRRLLVTACEGVADEQLVEPFAADLVGTSSGTYVSERAFSAYLGEHRMVAWKRHHSGLFGSANCARVCGRLDARAARDRQGTALAAAD